jgi:serine/threonine protein kinase
VAKRNALPYVPYHLQVGQRLPGHEEYRNERLLGQGGMGSVYEMVRGELEFRVAAKIMHRDLAARPEFVKMFLEEGRILKQVGDHPNIVRILDYSKLADATPFIVMELLEGQSLGGFARLRAGKPFEREAAFGIMGETLEGVFELHSQGIIHRDLKPDNIYLQLRHTAGDDSAVKILDCGLAYKQERAHESTVQGTPRYMAPEQVRGEPVSPQTDIYAIAVILCEMLLGRLPFELKSESTKDLLDAHLWKAPIPLSQFLSWLSPTANAAIMSALDKDPTKRPRSAFEFQSQLYLEAERLRKGLPPEWGVDANTTTPDPMDFSAEFLSAGGGAQANQTLPMKEAPKRPSYKATLRMETAPTHPATPPGDVWQGPPEAPPAWSPPVVAVSPGPPPAPVYRTPDPRPVAVGWSQPSVYASRPPSIAHPTPLAAPTSRVDGRASVSPSASSSDTGTARSVPHEPMHEEPAYDFRRELRRRALTRWTLLVAGLAFSAFVATAAVRVASQPPPAAVPPDPSPSLAREPPSAPIVPVPIPSAPAAVVMAPTAAPPVTPPPPASVSTPPVVAVASGPTPSAVKVAAPRPPAARAKPAPVASDGSDELFRPWRAN